VSASHHRRGHEGQPTDGVPTGRTKATGPTTVATGRPGCSSTTATIGLFAVEIRERQTNGRLRCPRGRPGSNNKGGLFARVSRPEFRPCRRKDADDWVRRFKARRRTNRASRFVRAPRDVQARAQINWMRSGHPPSGDRQRSKKPERGRSARKKIVGLRTASWSARGDLARVTARTGPMVAG